MNEDANYGHECCWKFCIFVRVSRIQIGSPRYVRTSEIDETHLFQVNDDRILEAAAKFTATLPTTASAAAAAAIPAAVAAARPLHRQLALITGDRGMNIKVGRRIGISFSCVRCVCLICKRYLSHLPRQNV